MERALKKSGNPSEIGCYGHSPKSGSFSQLTFYHGTRLALPMERPKVAVFHVAVNWWVHRIEHSLSEAEHSQRNIWQGGPKISTASFEGSRSARETVCYYTCVGRKHLCDEVFVTLFLIDSAISSRSVHLSICLKGYLVCGSVRERKAL